LTKEETTMTFDDFMGLAQNNAHLATGGETHAAVRATLETLGERLPADAAANLAAQLPHEVGLFLQRGGAGEAQRFSLPDFYTRVQEREEPGVERPDAVHHAKAVVAAVDSAVQPGSMEKLRGQLDESYADLFELVSQA
jgi:uncharacterized protein (DUF2267 family)